MNKRIQELAEQADPEHWHSRWYSGINPRVMDSEIKKFTHLIIADAINTVERRFMGDLNREDMEVRRCVADLKAHFGVKD